MSSNSCSYGATFVIVGGGIAGITCAEHLALELPEQDILLISASPLLKAVSNVKKFSRMLEEFEVEEKPFSALESQYPNIKVILASVTGLDAQRHEIYLSSKQKVSYQKLCLCAGGIPKVIAVNNPYVLGIRDTETIQEFQKRLADAERVVVVGNGGIAIELVYGIENCEVIWAIKDKSIGATFFDPGAAEFFLPCLNVERSKETSLLKRTKYSIEEWQQPVEGCSGSALGPDWSSNISMRGKGAKPHNVHVEFSCEVQNIFTPEEFTAKHVADTEIRSLRDGKDSKTKWPVYIQLTNNNIFGCNFIISATGVVPNIEPFCENNKFDISSDGGFSVNEQMQTSVEDIYAAGDLCTPSWEYSRHWFQMRLWTQARQMGAYAARCMAANLSGEQGLLDICFDLFTHVTRFFGYKVILLGLFNGQKLNNDCELLLRVTKGEEYVKVILQDGHMQGAILIGETDLEETFENLTLNQLDLTPYGEDLLNPNIDIEDYFD